MDSSRVSTCISIPCAWLGLQYCQVLQGVFDIRCCFGAFRPRELLLDSGTRARLFSTEWANACWQAFALHLLLEMRDLVHHIRSQFALGVALLAMYFLLQTRCNTEADTLQAAEGAWTFAHCVLPMLLLYYQPEAPSWKRSDMFT